MLIFYTVALISLCIILKKNRKLSFLLFFLLLFIGACRDITIGTDTGTWYYKNWFFTTFNPNTWNHYTPFEPGFNLYIAFFKKYISSSYTAFYSLLFIFTYILFIYFFKNEKYNIGIGLSLFLLTGNYLFCLNIMRQTLALSIAVIIISKYIKDNRHIQFFLSIILVSFLVHKSILILGLTPLFKLNKIKNYLNTKTLFLLWLVFLFLSNNIYLINAIYPYIQLLTHNTTYARHIDALIEYGEQERTVGYVGFSILILSLLKLSEGKRTTYFYIGYIGLLFSMLTKSIMPELGRVFINMSFFIVPYLTTFYQNIKTTKKIDLYILYIVAVYLVFSFISNLENSSFIPYKTFF